MRDLALPNAPSAVREAEDLDSGFPSDAPVGRQGGAASLRVAPKYAIVIEPEYRAQPLLSANSKMRYTAREIFSYPFPAAVVISAALSQAAESDPEYGDGGTAFAQRIGASAARQASQAIFSDAVFAPILHQDPRYYVMGQAHSTLKRFAYAATRVLVSRTDHGRRTPNLALLAGYGGSAALTQLYYPERSQNTETVLSSYGLSLGGRAIGYELQEFARFLVRSQPR